MNDGKAILLYSIIYCFYTAIHSSYLCFIVASFGGLYYAALLKCSLYSDCTIDGLNTIVVNESCVHVDF